MRIRHGLKKPDNKGFTLMEILIAIIIIAVLAGLAVPLYRTVVERSRRAEAIGVLSATRQSEMRYFAQNNRYTTAPAELDYNPTAADTSGQSRHFGYAIPTGTATNLTVRATRNTFAGGDNSSTVTINEAGTVAGTGIFG